MAKHVIIIAPNGNVRGLYSPFMEALAKAIGPRNIRRASHVDVYRDLSENAQFWIVRNRLAPGASLLTLHPDINNSWWADLLISRGPVLGPFDTRDAALAAEVVWLEEHHIPIP